MIKASLPIFLLLTLFFLITQPSAAQNQTPVQPVTVAKSSPAKYQLSYRIINSNERTYGYDILNNNRIVIHQPSVPAIPGNKGFLTKEEASRVAKFVIEKISNNIMPPTVTTEDLKKLKIKI